MLRSGATVARKKDFHEAVLTGADNTARKANCIPFNAWPESDACQDAQAQRVARTLRTFSFRRIDASLRAAIAAVVCAKLKEVDICDA